jgi:hypothetical protein
MRTQEIGLLQAEKSQADLCMMTCQFRNVSLARPASIEFATLQRPKNG